MIKYKLICKDCEISFDSWFSSSGEYEKLKKSFLLNCHICNSLNVKKTMMSPSILGFKDNIKINIKNKKYKEIKKRMSEYQGFIKRNFDYVGDNFAYEARTLHYNNKKISKGIYGSATKEDIKELHEEDIEVNAIPWVEDSSN